MFKGTLSEEEMEDEHPRELAEIKAGQVDPRPDAKTLARRRRVFFPIYALLVLAMLAGVAFFVLGETTAVATVPPAEVVVVYAPQTPTPLPTLPPTATPTPVTPTATAAPGAEETPAAAAVVTWQNGIGELMKAKCGTCHSSAAKAGGLDLTSYQAALSNGNSGPGVVPGEPNTSLVVSRQSSGKHPGMFSAEELEQIIHWIESGAPEQ
jgi:hypothetical protein